MKHTSAVLSSRDARSLTHEALAELRRLAVKRVLAGETHEAVADSIQVNKGTVGKWMMRYRAEGDAMFVSRKAAGPAEKLSAKQQDRLRKLIVTKSPRQLRFSFALWTLPLIGELITREFGIVLHETTVSRMLRRMGLTPQVPTRQAFQRDEDECTRWAKEEFPAIVATVRRKQAVLVFADEAGVHADGPIGRTWGVRGRTPVVQTTGNRQRVNVISAISPRGRLWFRCFNGTLKAEVFTKFLQDLLHDVRGEIILIIDRHPAHVAASTKRYIHKRRDRLTVHFLPGYAPDMNPDEHVWSYLKGLFRQDPLEKQERLTEAVNEAMLGIKEDRELVRTFFDHPAVKYVKDALAWH